MDEEETFWLFDLKKIFMFEFIPKKNMKTITIMNVLSRDLIILLLIVLIFDIGESISLLIISLLIFIVVLYILIDNVDKNKDKFKILDRNSFNYINNSPELDNKHDENICKLDDINKPSCNTYIDLKKDIKKVKKCRIPTTDNPFMNYNISDFGSDVDEMQCEIDEGTRREIDKKFNEGLYKSASDLFDIKNSQRQFYSIRFDPEGQDKLGQWLYKVPPTCKENTAMCNRYDDLRYAKRTNYIE